MVTIKHVCTLVGLWLLLQQNTGLMAQVNASASQFERVRTAEALASQFVRSIVEDRHGFIWLGTTDGLARFDGRDFKVFQADAANPRGLRNARVKCLYRDSRDRLWIGTSNGGLHRYDDTSETFDNWRFDPDSPNSLSANSVHALLEDRDGTLWLATTGGGLNHMDPASGQVTVYKHDPTDETSISSDHVAALFEDSHGNLWVGTHAGLDLFQRDSRTFVRHPLHPEIRRAGSSAVAGATAGMGVGAIWGDGKDTLWLATLLGLVRYDPAGGTSELWQVEVESEGGVEPVAVTTILPETGSRLWVGTMSAGLYLFSPEQNAFQPVLKAGGTEHAAQGAINCLYRSQSGMLWIGTSAGLYKGLTAAPHEFHTLEESIGPNALTSNYIWPIFEARDGVIWIGTMSGLNAYDPKTGTVIQYHHNPDEPTSLSVDAVISIFEDGAGALWVGTFMGGVNRFNSATQSFERFRYDRSDATSLPHDLVNCFHEDRDGTLWVGTAKGLARFDRGLNRFVRYSPPGDSARALADRNVLGILQASDGRLWLATGHSGLWQIDEPSGRVHNWHHQPGAPYSLSSNALGDIISLPDSVGPGRPYLWLGTEGGGLNRFDPETEETVAYTVGEGLADNNVRALVADDAGILWISSDKGLTRFDPVTETARIYDERDGIPDADFNPWAGMKSRSGDLYFGGQHGIIHFDPANFLEDPEQRPPAVVLTTLEVFDRPVPIGENTALRESIVSAGEIHLNYTDYMFSLEFAALDFARPERNRYAYKMEGFHDNWVRIGTRRRVDFTNLDPGSYVFSVRGTNSAGVWNEEGTSIRISIASPFWGTWWFRGLTVSVVIVLLAGFHQYRISTLRKVERVRASIAQDLHDDIASSLASVKVYSEVLKEQIRPEANETRDLLERIRNLSDEVMDGIGQIIWSIDPRHDTLHDLLKHLQKQAAQIFASKRMAFHCRFPDKLGALHLNPDQRRSLYLILKEGITNIVKHAKASKVELICEQKGRALTFSLRDDGCGFDASVGSGGHGLENMRKRAQLIGAELDVSSNTGGGANLTLQIRIT